HSQRRGGRDRGWRQPRRGPDRRPMLRGLGTSSVFSLHLVHWCPGTCRLAFCDGMIERRSRGRLCVFVDERKRTCGGEALFERIACFGVHIRPPRVPVPACPDSYLPGVCIITESRTLYL